MLTCLAFNSPAFSKIVFGDIDNKIKDSINRSFQNEVVNGDEYSREKYAYSVALGALSFGLPAADALKGLSGIGKIDEVAELGGIGEIGAEVSDSGLVGEGVSNAVENIKPKYRTAIDDSVTVIDKQELPESLGNTFTDGEYRTVVTNEDITLYRDFGFKAYSDGGFATTSPAQSAIQARIDSALLPEWKNSIEYEEEIVVPKGTVLQVGKVAPQVTKGGITLTGGADQVILPIGWDTNWVKGVRTLSVGGK